jgi:hypothetical protein
MSFKFICYMLSLCIKRQPPHGNYLYYFNCALLKMEIFKLVFVCQQQQSEEMTNAGHVWIIPSNCTETQWR